MKISSFIPESYIDYSGKISSVIFTPGCNFACPSCHAGKIVRSELERIEEENIFSYIKRKKRWVEGIVICGGEPTLQIGLIPFLREVKKIPLQVKLDTNGSNPAELQQLLEEELVDYVAMDIKGPGKFYNKLTGRQVDLRELSKAISIATRFPDYEFRTTIVPVIIEGNINYGLWTKENTGEMAEFVLNITGTNQSRYYLQNFVSRDEEEMLDDRLSKQKLPKEMQTTPNAVMSKVYETMKEYFPNVKIR